MDGAVEGCILVDSLYVKANGEMPCWDDVGEELILRRLDPAALAADREPDILGSARLLEVRRAFLAGRVPHPGTCERCALLGHGRTRTLRPTRLEVLHVEPSYLCRLSCPQCIPSRQRRTLKRPPYVMTPAMYDGLLRQLAREGVESIRFVHFEGRGEPLDNPWLGELVASTRRRYPSALTTVTTHGSMPYRPWMSSSGLHVLRVSVDGATAESYRRYRVGGSFPRALALMRRVAEERARSGRGPRVEWKYILFSWNDGDDEIREAGRLADEMGIDLRFCLTHSPGRSQRYLDEATLAAALPGLAPRAAFTSTYQLRGDRGDGSVRPVVAEHADALLRDSLRRLGGPDRREGLTSFGRALGEILGVDVRWDAASGFRMAMTALDGGDPSPAVLSALANAAQMLGHDESAARYFERYLAFEPPDAVGARGAGADAYLRAALASFREGDVAGGWRLVGRGLALEVGLASASGAPERLPSSQVLGRARPAALEILANCMLAIGAWDEALRLFDLHRERAPRAINRAEIDVTRERLRRMGAKARQIRVNAR